MREERSMELPQLVAVMSVAETGSVTKAARLLHLVQPAVTRRIRALEQELGVILFDRTRQGMLLTDAGVVLVEHAGRAMRELERARAEIQEVPDAVSGSVGVGILESVVDLVVEPLFAAIAAQFPDITLRVLTAYSGHLQRSLDVGDIDVSLLYELSGAPSLAVLPILREGIWAVGPPDSPLKPDAAVPLRTLLAQPLVLPVAGHGLRALFDQAMVSTSIRPRTVAETNSMHLQKTLVMARGWWTVLPAAGVATDVAAERITAAPLMDPEVTRTVMLGLQRGRRSPPAVQAVARELTEVVRSLVVSGDWPATLVDR
jgi:LysR family transcriptional regulator, nitrogen assimilation regulatory protein